MLYSLLFSKIWEKEGVPALRKEGIIIKLPKNETLETVATIEGSCSCQRQARFSNRILLETMKEAVDPKL